MTCLDFDGICEKHVLPTQRDLVFGGGHPQGPGCLESTHVWDETALQNTQQAAAGKKRGAPLEPELGHGHHGPQNHLHGDPAVGTNPFRHQLRRHLGAEEGKFEDRVAEIVVCEYENWSV